MDSEDFDRLVGQLYDAALVPEKLPETLAALTRCLDGDTCHLVGWDGRSGTPLLSTTIGFDEGIGLDYAAHYAAIDPRRLIAEQKLSTGELLICHEHFDAWFVSRSEFFQDYLLPIGVHHTLASTLIQNDRQLVQIAFQRYVGHAYFSSLEAHFLQRLIPHLQRAITLMLRCNDQHQQSQFMDSGLAATSLGLIALDHAGRLLYCNPSGDALLREGEIIRLRDGLLCLGKGSRKSSSEDFASAISKTARSGRPLNLLLGNNNHPHRRYSLTLTALPKQGTMPALASVSVASGVLCILAPLDRRRVATTRQLIELLGLSPAEARLSRALASGESLEDYARESDLRLPTVKTQLRSIFAKTACDRQASLMRLITAIPPVRDEG
jgi:DNA-binding CsgD family transcriptional regulator